MKKAFISLPITGLTDEQIKHNFAKAKKRLEKLGYTVVNSIITTNPKDMNKYVNPPIWFIGKSLEKLAECDAAYFCTGWKESRGCKIEHSVAKAYNVPNIYYEGYKVKE